MKIIGNLKDLVLGFTLYHVEVEVVSISILLTTLLGYLNYLQISAIFYSIILMHFVATDLNTRH